MNEKPQLRTSEWLLSAFFVYTALLTAYFPPSPSHRLLPVWIAVGVVVLFGFLAWSGRTRYAKAADYARDWIPIALTYVAFREMELFATPRYDVALESAWIKADQLLLGVWHGRALIESCGPLLPTYLELCYLLVYGVPAYGVTLLWLKHRRPDANRFLFLYLLGTLAAYALFPFWPTEPPRYAFPLVEPPHVITALHRLNVAVLKAGTIHTGVFPSAHVSSAFAAGCAMVLLFPHRKRYGLLALGYAVSVSIATIYGRYHYVADVLGGIGISLIPAAAALFWVRPMPTSQTAAIAAPVTSEE